jgi:ribose-phosphate pyrophosphokinase
VILVDDMISTAGSVVAAAKTVKEHGALDIYIAATHGLFCGPAIERLSAAPIKEVAVSDTIPLPVGCKKLKNLAVLSVAPMLGEAISRIHRNESVSSLFMNEA